MKDIENLIRHRQLYPLYQPIVSLQGRNIHGYEGLVRGPSDSPLHAPQHVFEAAFRENLLAEADLLAREVCLAGFSKIRLPGLLFLNVNPITLLQPGFQPGRTVSTVRELGFDPGKIVIELTEQYPVDNVDALAAAVAHYRSMGFLVALDDLGAGYSGLRLWSQIKPDYVKIDRYFIQQINEDLRKQDFVSGIVQMARNVGCQVVAEGIETEPELDVVLRLGIALGQGYYFCRPQAIPPTEIPFDTLMSGTRRAKGWHSGLGMPVCSLLSNPPFYVIDSTPADQVAAMFRADPMLYSLPICNDDAMPVGIVRRTDLLARLSGRFGYDLHGRKPIGQLMEEALILDYLTPLDQVSQIVTSSSRPDQDFIVVKDGYYLGLGRMSDLLRVITDIQLRTARYANPLTLLPGNVPIHEQLDALLNDRAMFTVCYVDLDNFKPFNDVYGYAAGDEVIRRLADLLTQAVSPEIDFVGHIGGDDFILILRSSDWRSRCQSILDHFRKIAPEFYRPEDVAAGGIQAENRQGEPMFFGLLSLSIGVVQPDPQRCRSHLDIGTLASNAKHEAKLRPGNSMFVSRRRGQVIEQAEVECAV